MYPSLPISLRQPLSTPRAQRTIVCSLMLLMPVAALWGLRVSKQLAAALAPAAVPADRDPRLPTTAFSGCPALSSVPAGCYELRQACFDMRWVVLHGEEYQPRVDADQPAMPLPRGFAQPATFPFISSGDSNADMMKLGGLPDAGHNPPVLFRTPSQYDPPDVAQPQWSCQVPLLLHTAWSLNYGHTLGNAASWLYNRLTAGRADQQLAERVQVAVALPWDLSLPSWSRVLLQPMSRQPVTTFADLSSRGGNHSRCFASVLMCEQAEAWQAWGVWQASQHTVEYYRPQWEAIQPNVTWRSAAPAGDGLPLPASAGADAGPPRRMWRVLFQARNKAVRQFLNLQELLDSCAAWRYTDPDSGTVHTAECGVWPSRPLPAAIAYAQAADIVVGTHGSNSANSFFMKPGSAFIEVHHVDWPHQFTRNWHAMDPESRLHWWGFLVKDRGLYKPTEAEERLRRAGTARPEHWDVVMRDRNLRLPWKHLRSVLDQIAHINGSIEQYRQLAATGRILVEVETPGSAWVSQLRDLWERWRWEHNW